MTKKAAPIDIDENWETIIARRIEMHRGTYKPQRIEDASKRNSAEATKRWRKKNWGHYKSKQKEWLAANPEKVKVYQQRNKKNTKRWAKEHPERIRELGRINDAKRAKSPKRTAWKQEYLQRPEVKARRAEQSKARELKPERIAWRKAYEKKRAQDPVRKAKQKIYQENRKAKLLKQKETSNAQCTHG